MKVTAKVSLNVEVKFELSEGDEMTVKKVMLQAEGIALTALESGYDSISNADVKPSGILRATEILISG